ncbi:unnamed protein product [Closterium sp. NIES-65]|nr:unnamed protein product [Closterium sp. NIES-65]
MAGRCYLLSVSNLVGAWFEVGSSALHKFSTASGLSCNAAKYSALATATDGSNVAGCGAYPQQQGRISRNLRRVCEAAVYSAGRTRPCRRCLCRGLRGRPSRSTIRLGALQQHNNRASTFTTTRRTPGLDVTKQGLADAANRIIAAAGRAQRAGMRGSLAVLQMQLMLPAANSSAATRFTSRLSWFPGARVLGTGSEREGGPGDDCDSPAGGVGAPCPPSPCSHRPFPWNSQTQLRMQAVQDRKQPGKFAVSLFGFARNNNYLINKLEGNADSEYNMATIVSCDGGQELVKETVGACPDVQTSNTFMAEFFQVPVRAPLGGVVKRGIRMTTPARQSQIQGLSKSALAVRDHLRSVCTAIARPPRAGQLRHAANTIIIYPSPLLPPSLPSAAAEPERHCGAHAQREWVWARDGAHGRSDGINAAMAGLMFSNPPRHALSPTPPSAPSRKWKPRRYTAAPNAPCMRLRNAATLLVPACLHGM